MNPNNYNNSMITNMASGGQMMTKMDNP